MVDTAFNILSSITLILIMAEVTLLLGQCIHEVFREKREKLKELNRHR